MNRRNGLGAQPGRTNTSEDFDALNNALATVEDTNEASQLKPIKVDFHISDNRESHHTDEYAMESLIVRRGQEFKATVTFDRPFDDKQDKLILLLTFGSHPQESKKSLIRVKETNQLVTSSWGMRTVGSHGNIVDLSIMPPHDALVGEYSVYVETRIKKSGSEDEYLSFRKKLDETFVVLFNAWCKDDVVYMEDDAHRQEYVMNDHGRIWVGDKHNGKPWYFGQFEDVSLPSCLHILEVCDNMKSSARGNAVWVSRTISQMVNSNDDDGILVGNWSGKYKPFTEPSAWAGSVAILKEYYNKDPKEGVKYGQCWVFSGLATTLLRAVGIPTRSVTNFASAHDTDASMTIDFHIKNGEPMEHLNDSVWNFHVWNECHFARPDLPQGYGGWQVVDATPQETSDGVFCCGPCPTKAIKEGEVYIPYDGKFIFGEVNGDLVYWDIDENWEMTVTDIKKHSIGKNISTKAVGSSHREDVTKYYKYSEGSKEEREAVHKANAYSSRKDEHIYKQAVSNDVTFDFIPQDDDDLMIGSDFEVKLRMINTSRETRTVKVSIVTNIAFYTGITVVNLNTKHDTVELQGNQSRSVEKTVLLRVQASDYIGKTPAEANVQLFCKATVQETKQTFHEIETVEFKKPEIKGKDLGWYDEYRHVRLYFTNPLGINLNNGVFNIETSRHVSPNTITTPLYEPVGPGEDASVIVSLMPERTGRRTINVSFSSDQLTGVVGEIEILGK